MPVADEGASFKKIQSENKTEDHFRNCILRPPTQREPVQSPKR